MSLIEEEILNKNYISCLYDHIDEAFQYGNKELTAKILPLVAKGLVRGREIKGDIFPMRGPYSNLETGTIVLQAGFLSYLWTVCYFMLGLIEIYEDKAHENTPVVSLSDSDKFPILNHTFAWGRSLKLASEDDYTPWPDHIANPTQSETRVRQANHLFVLATVYLMYHELGHLVLHADSLEFIKTVKSSGYIPNEPDSRRLRTMEVQADIYALDYLVSYNTDEHELYMKYMAAILAQLAEFFIRQMPDTRGKNYPDLDERLKRVINRIDLQHPGYKMYVDLTCGIGIQLFFSLTFAEFIPPDRDKFSFEDFDDLKKYLFKIIQAWKDKYNSN